MSLMSCWAFVTRLLVFFPHLLVVERSCFERAGFKICLESFIASLNSTSFAASLHIQNVLSFIVLSFPCNLPSLLPWRDHQAGQHSFCYHMSSLSHTSPNLLGVQTMSSTHFFFFEDLVIVTGDLVPNAHLQVKQTLHRIFQRSIRYALPYSF
jgi:hypothetical protein